MCLCHQRVKREAENTDEYRTSLTAPVQQVPLPSQQQNHYFHRVIIQNYQDASAVALVKQNNHQGHSKQTQNHARGWGKRKKNKNQNETKPDSSQTLHSSLDT